MSAIASTLALLSLLGAADAAEPRETALLPLRVHGLQLNDAAELNKALRTQLTADPRLSVQAEAATDMVVSSSQSLGLDCELTDVGCAVQLGQLADVEQVLLGEAVKLSDRVGINLTLIDVGEGRVLRKVSGLAPANPEEQIAGLEEVLRHLLDEGAKTGALQVEAEPAGARVQVNGRSVGEAPVARVEGLVPGEVAIRVEQKGFEPYEARLFVAPGEVATASVTLAPDAEATVEREIGLLERAAPLGVAGAGAVVVLGGLITGAVGAVPLVGYGLESLGMSAFDPAGQTPAQAATEASVAYERAEGYRASWNTWGQAALFGGIAVSVVGAATVAVGAGWAGYLLLATAEE